MFAAVMPPNLLIINELVGYTDVQIVDMSNQGKLKGTLSETLLEIEACH